MQQFIPLELFSYFLLFQCHFSKPNSEIRHHYRNWQTTYRQRECRYRRSIFQNQSYPPCLRLESEPDEDFGDDLIDNMNEWLNHNQSTQFRYIERKLIRELSRHEDIELILQTDNPYLQRLPWEKWDVFQDYRSVEVCLIPSNSSIPRAIINTRNSEIVSGY